MARLVQRPIESLTGWRERYGDVFTVPLIVFGIGVYVCDPDAIREMLTGDQSDLHAGEANEPLSPVLGDKSVLILDGREHMRQRKLLLPPFQGSAVQNFREVIREVAEAEVDGWREGESFVDARADAGADLRGDRPRRLRRHRARADRAPAQRPGLGDRHADDLRSAERPAPRPRALQSMGPVPAPAEGRRRAPLRGDRPPPLEADLEERTDVLSLLLRARDEEGEPMTDIELRDELMTMLLAGHETTATGLAFAFDLLPRTPDVLARLRDELEGDDDAYLDAVVTETLRLRPVIDAAERTLTKPRTIGGWDLPAGIRVYPAIAVVHLREDLYPQPDEFRPERFVDEEAPSYAWLPFGGGIRRCIGAALAQAEMAEVIRTVVSRVELEPTRPEPRTRRHARHHARAAARHAGPSVSRVREAESRRSPSPSGPQPPPASRSARS